MGIVKTNNVSEYKQIPQCIDILGTRKNTQVVTLAGNILTVQSSDKCFNTENTIIRIGNDFYINKRDNHTYQSIDRTSGRFEPLDGDDEYAYVWHNADNSTVVMIRAEDVRSFDHNKMKRTDDVNEVRRTMRNIRDLVNANTGEPTHCRMLTVTYHLNDGIVMNDIKRLDDDLKKFYQTLRYHYGHFEYVSVVEPQRSGAWHAHMILIFPTHAPWMNHDDVEQYWGHGYIKVTRLDSCNNVGVYLSAHLSDIAVNEDGSECAPDDIPKSIIKGGRLWMYPAGMRIYRTSKGVKRPQRVVCDKRSLPLDSLGVSTQKEVSHVQCTYTSLCTVELPDGQVKTLLSQQYNLAIGVSPAVREDRRRQLIDMIAAFQDAKESGNQDSIDEPDLPPDGDVAAETVTTSDDLGTAAAGSIKKPCRCSFRAPNGPHSRVRFPIRIRRGTVKPTEKAGNAGQTEIHCRSPPVIAFPQT